MRRECMVGARISRLRMQRLKELFVAEAELAQLSRSNEAALVWNMKCTTQGGTYTLSEPLMTVGKARSIAMDGGTIRNRVHSQPPV